MPAETEEKVDEQTDQTEEETNELHPEDVVSEEAIESATEIGSILEDDDDKDTDEDETDADDKDTEGKEAADKDASEEKVDDDKKSKADDNSGQEEQKDAEIDDSLLQRAVDAGMPISQARSFGSKADLETSVSFAESQNASHAKTVENNSDAKAAAEKKAVEDEDEVKVEKVNFDHLIEAGYDKDLVDTLNKTVGGLTDKIEQLTKDVKAAKSDTAELKTSTESRDTDRALNDFDERIGKLPDEFKEVFGEGNFDGLLKTSKEYGQRSKVLGEMGALSAGYNVSKQPMPPIQTLLERAVYNVTGKTVTAKQSEKSEKKKDEKVKDDLAKRAKSAIGKPSGGKVKDQTNAGKALQAAKQVSRVLDGKQGAG